jgi:hypothetical protein
MRTRVDPTPTAAWVTSHRLWLVSVLAFGVGDVVTTGVGVGMDGIVEAGPVAAHLLQRYSFGALLLLKLAVLYVAFAAWRVVPDPYRVGIPAGLALVGVVATSWNLSVLVAAG